MSKKILVGWETVIHIARQVSQMVPDRLLETTFPDTLFKFLDDDNYWPSREIVFLGWREC